MDPAVLCRLATSCEEARQVDATHYEGTMTARVAVFTIRAQVRGEVLALQPPHFLEVALEGQSSGLPGTFRGRARLNLRPVPDGTIGEYAVTLAVLGRLGSLGQPFFQSTAQRLATTFAGKVAAYLKHP